MKAKLLVLVLAVLMVGSFTTAAVALVKSDDDKDGKGGKGDDKASHGKAFGRDKDKHDKKLHGNAPPWAGNPMEGGRPGGRGADKAWKEHWRSLTPAQRADTMARLAQEHADGMKKWAACVKAAGDDKAARSECERPLPPGLAKKLLR